MLIYESGIYYWSGSLPQRKRFVSETLMIDGNWISPGGDAKLFKSTNSEYSIKWYGTRSEKLVIQTDEDQYLKRSLAILVNVIEESNARDDVSFANVPTRCDLYM